MSMFQTTYFKSEGANVVGMMVFRTNAKLCNLSAL